MSDLSPSWGEWLGVSLPPLDGLAFWSWLWPNRCKGDCWRGVFFLCFCVETWRFESCLLGPWNLKHASSNVTSSNIEGNLEQKVGGLVTLDSWTDPGLHIYDFVWFVVIGKRNQRWICTLPFTVYTEIGIGFLLIILHDLLENGIFSTNNSHIEALRKAPCVGFAPEVS